jgi:hypothetical protein
MKVYFDSDVRNTEEFWDEYHDWRDLIGVISAASVEPHRPVEMSARLVSKLARMGKVCPIVVVEE